MAQLDWSLPGDALWKTWYPGGELKPYSRAIGEVVHVFGDVEWILRNFVVRLRGGSGAEAFVSDSHRTLGSLLTALRAAAINAVEATTDFRDLIEQWVAKAEPCVRQRNALVHARWFFDDGTDLTIRNVRIPYKGNPVPIVARHYTVQSIESVRDEGIIALCSLIAVARMYEALLNEGM